MRYITYSRIAPGMVLATPFYGPNLKILLEKGMELSEGHIQRIKDRGYSGAYIEDELSEGIAIDGLIPEEIRMEAVMASKDILQAAEKGRKEFENSTRNTQRRLVEPIIDELIGGRRLLDMMDLKPFDDYMYYHTANAMIISLLVGIEMGLSSSMLSDLGMAALLHDVGNIFIPKSILDKPGKLLPEEFEIIKAHSEMGFNYLRKHFQISIEGCMGALHHHENYDGTGYPYQRKKDEISIYGRIIAVADVYDALLSRRPFREPVLPPAAMDYMEASAGGMFDPEVLAALKRVVALYPTGFGVELDNGMTCIVVENHRDDPSRPAVRPIGEHDRPGVINLHSDPAYSQIGVAEIVEI